MSIKELMKASICKYILCFMLGILTSLVTTSFMHDCTASSILYVSQQEILLSEQERVKATAIEHRELFYGKVDEAARLAISLAKGFGAKAGVRVVYSEGPVVGENVHSISVQVHKQIIDRLSK